MNKSLKAKIKERWQQIKADHKARRSLFYLMLTIITGIALVVFNALRISGLPGVILRLLCVAVFVIILVKITKA